MIDFLALDRHQKERVLQGVDRLRGEDRQEALCQALGDEDTAVRQQAIEVRTLERNSEGIYNQLDKLEAGGVLRSRTIGSTRLYSFNPRYPVLKELKNLLEKVLSLYPEEKREELLMNRRRPRRRGNQL